MIPGEPAYEGLGREQHRIALHDEYEELVAKEECDVCQPEPCKDKKCSEKDRCPCFKAMPFDLWLKKQNGS